MANDDGGNLSKTQLKDIVQNIVLDQGNIFIKELLRVNKSPIGVTKSDFLKNINVAIDSEKLTEEMLEAWIDEIEGWGNQHIFLFEKLSLNENQLEEAIQKSDLRSFLNRKTVQEFPENLTLTSISLTENSVSLSMHQGHSSWKRAKSKDFQREEDADLYEFRSYRRYSRREIARFEWLFSKPYSVVYLPASNDGDEREVAFSGIWQSLLDANLIERMPARIPLSNAVSNLSADSGNVTAKTRTMWANGGSVALASSLPDGGIAEVAAVREVGRSIDPSDFQSADGRFNLSDKIHPTLSRPVTAEVIGRESRIRVWVRCKREDVYYLTDYIWNKN